jgi:hypothetical protein
MASLETIVGMMFALVVALVVEILIRLKHAE